MRKLGRIPFYAVWFYVVFCAFITWQEYYTPISAEDYCIVVLARVLLLGSAIPVGFVLRENPFTLWANAFMCMNFLLYSMVGHFYQPLYYACFMQTIIAFSILFFTTRRQHFILLTFKATAFILFYLYTYDLVKYRPGPETKADFVMTILMAYGLATLFHHLFTAERGLREAANERFALLGRHASNIVHDVKGSLGIPQLYLQKAQQCLEAGDYAEARELLGNMERSLAHTEKTIFDLNQLSRLTEGDPRPFPASAALRDVLDILRKRLHDVAIEIDGDFEIKAQRGVVCSVFLNLILNSVEGFKRAGTAAPRIRITLDPASRTVSFTDNGGGFSKAALTALKGGQAPPPEASGSGLGLYLVRENLRSLRGRIAFENTAEGAKVDVTLPG